MNEELNELIENLGQGLCGPVAYDTAVVACIPSLEDLTKPAFPEALEWIRNHQLSDGSWGTDRPVYAHGNTLSTLAAIIALKKWHNNDDNEFISRGIKALKGLAEKIASETHESIGYELILPSLLRKAQEYGLKIPFQEFECSQKYAAKLELIENFVNTFGFKKKHTFWYSLEMTEGFITNKFNNFTQFLDNVLDENGSVSASPSATAFLLKNMRVEKGIDVEKAYTYIENLIHLHNGGIPTISPSDTFELSWSLSALLMAGVPPNYQTLKPGVDKLYEKWLQFDGMIGCSSYLPPDSDATSIFIYVLYSANRLSQFDSINTLLSFYNGSYLNCFKGERNPSVSSNINALIALRMFAESPNIMKIIAKTVSWILNQSSYGNFILEDKWHFSPYYCISRAVFALQGLNDEFAERCVKQLLCHQKGDGGWGIGSESTLEETAHVSLALCHWFKTNVNQRNEKNIKVLKAIDNFFKQFSGKVFVELWIGKVLYCPTTVVTAFIIAAKYSLENTIKAFGALGINFKL